MKDEDRRMNESSLASKPISVVTSFVLVRATSWIVLFVRKTKDDPRSHTNQHEPKHSCLELDPTFEAKLMKALFHFSSFILHPSSFFFPPSASAR
jgi:hypothetical protein